jgi:hypothetical protein
MEVKLMRRLEAIALSLGLVLIVAPEFAQAQTKNGIIENACTNGVVGPPVSIDFQTPREKVDILIPSENECVYAPKGFSIDVDSFNQDEWAEENKSVSHWDWRANDDGCGPPRHCFGVSFYPAPTAQKICYVAFGRGSKPQQHLWATYRPCVIIVPNSYTISVTILPTGKGVVTSLPEASTIGDCKSTCAAHFDGKTNVTLSAAGDGFTGWTGDPECNGQKDHSISILPRHVLINCYANFK